jgi:predicted nucleic acid-binding protein
MRNHDGVFLDSNGWIALLSANDRWHVRAVEEFEQIRLRRRRLVTTDWVLAETGNGLARTTARDRFAGAVERFRESPNCHFARVDDDLFQEALIMYDRITDKSWGLVDCASFVVMQREHILDAFTMDYHFQQAGFQPLLAARPR